MQLIAALRLKQIQHRYISFFGEMKHIITLCKVDAACNQSVNQSINNFLHCNSFQSTSYNVVASLGDNSVCYFQCNASVLVLQWPPKKSFVNVAQAQWTVSTFSVTTSPVKVLTPTSEWAWTSLAAPDDIFQLSTSYCQQVQRVHLIICCCCWSTTSCRLFHV